METVSNKTTHTKTVSKKTTQKKTTQKVKVVGKQQYFNLSTGTVEEMQVTTFEERDYNFHKIWLKDFLNSIDMIGNQKTKLAFWIIDNITKENYLPYTYRQISEKSGISLGTVRDTMSILMNANFLKRLNQGTYLINSDIVFKGGRQARLNILHTYQNEGTDQKPLDLPKKIQNLRKSIEQLQFQLDKAVKTYENEKKKTALQMQIDKGDLLLESWRRELEELNRKEEAGEELILTPEEEAELQAFIEEEEAKEKEMLNHMTAEERQAYDKRQEQFLHEGRTFHNVQQRSAKTSTEGGFVPIPADTSQRPIQSSER